MSIVYCPSSDNGVFIWGSWEELDNWTTKIIVFSSHSYLPIVAIAPNDILIGPLMARGEDSACFHCLVQRIRSTNRFLYLFNDCKITFLPDSVRAVIDSLATQLVNSYCVIGFNGKVKYSGTVLPVPTCKAVIHHASLYSDLWEPAFSVTV